MRKFSVSIWGIVLFSALILLPTSDAHAFGNGKQEGSNKEIDIKDPMTARARFQPSSVEAGGTAELIIELDLAPGFHAYSERFKIIAENPDDLRLDQYKVSPLVPFKDAVSKSVKDGVEGKATMRLVVEVPAGYKPGALEPQFKLTYQACTSEFCLFPKSLILKAPLTITAGTGAGSAAPAMVAATPAPAKDDSAIQLRAALDKGILPALLLMFVVGFLTSLTPCIYPMIPITLAVLGMRAPKGGEKPSIWRSFSIAVAYVLGLAVTYSALGVAAASTGSLFGAALSNIYVVSVIAILFVAMGLGMYGLFEVQAPAFIRNRLGGSNSTQGGYAGAFSTGLVAGIIASPCIGPVLVSVLAFIAQTQDKLLGFILLFTFALGMGVIFIVLGLSSSLLGRLPRAGNWMDAVKYLFGTIMIGMAFYYIEPIYPKWLFVTLLGLSGLLLASFFGAFDPVEQPVTNSARLRKGSMLALFFFGVAFAGAGMMSRMNLLPAASTSAAPAPSGKIAWKPYSDEAFEAARRSGQPVIVDFMAEWCGACKELEELTYPKVADDMNKYILLKLDATESTPAIVDTTTKFGIVGLPTLLFFNSKGQPLPELTLSGFEDAAGFGARLKKGL